MSACDGPAPARTGPNEHAAAKLHSEPKHRAHSCQPMPEFTPDEYAAPRDDLAARGVLVPVTVDQHGRLLDGHHRRRVADELGVDCPTDGWTVVDDDEAHDLALTLNRRHLDQEHKRDLARAEIGRRPNDSDRAIGRRVGVDHKTVGRLRRELAGAESPHQPADGDRDPRLDRVVNEPDTQVAKQLAAELICEVITDLHELNPEVWQILYELRPVIESRGRGLHHIATFAAIAVEMFIRCDYLVPWLTDMAGLVIQLGDEIRERRSAPDWIGPAETLARLTRAIWNPALDVDTQRLLRRSLLDQLAEAIVLALPRAGEVMRTTAKRPGRRGPLASTALCMDKWQRSAFFRHNGSVVHSSDINGADTFLVYAHP